MRRRLDGFLDRIQMPGVAVYCKLLDRDAGALGKLKDFFTINVSQFFRDTEQFKFLRTRILPELLASNPQLNIWSAGCSHGAEAYFVALILSDISTHQGHRILATDIDAQILARAQAGGPYTAEDVKNVERRHLLRGFSRSDGAYWVNEGFRGRIE